MNAVSPDANEPRKPRLVPTLLLGVIIAGVLGSLAATVLVTVQYDILQLAEQATHTLLPDIQADVRTAANLERLKVFGEIVRHGASPEERREARLAARILTMDVVYEQDAGIKNQMNQVYALIERMATYRAEQDSARQRIEMALAQLDSPTLATYLSPSPPAGTDLVAGSATADLRDIIRQIHLLQIGISHPHGIQSRQAIKTLQQKLMRYRTSQPSGALAKPITDTDVSVERIQSLLEMQARVLDREETLSRTWAKASVILENLIQHLSVDTAVMASEGSAQIARYAKRAMMMVASALGGLILLFVATLYFIRRSVVKPILRVTAGLEQVRTTQGRVWMRRERLQELDDIATAVGAFGEALSQINERNLALEREVAEREQAQAKLLELATTDSLTGLRNRRHFMETAAQEFERARRYQVPLSLLMLDADRFKSVNDGFGHQIGDEVLQVLAATGLSQLREIDLFARLGGEEFAILLPQTDFAAARAVAERLRQAIAEQRVDTEQGPLNFTVSLGLASLDPTMVNLHDLLRQADIALYQAKQNGRNRVETTPA